MNGTVGRCSGEQCRYTLPLNEAGLVVAHSAPMTLDNCPGVGHPPLPPPPSRNERLAEAHEVVKWWLNNNTVNRLNDKWLLYELDEAADELLALPEMRALIGGEQP